MSEEQLNALLNYIDARIEEKLADEHHHDGLNEAIRRAACERELRAIFKDED